MTTDEALLLAGIAVVAAGLLFLLWRAWRALDAVFPDIARLYGLVHTREKQGSAFTNLRESERLAGQVHGLPLQVAATYETRGRLRIRGTWIATRVPAGLPPCNLTLRRSAPADGLHLVPTGDAAFDARWRITTDAPDAVRALVTQTARAELRACPQSELRVVVDGPHLVLSFPGTPSRRDELHAPIKAALAMARGGGA